jgi:hypothetical protein
MLPQHDPSSPHHEFVFPERDHPPRSMTPCAGTGASIAHARRYFPGKHGRKLAQLGWPMDASLRDGHMPTGRDSAASIFLVLPGPRRDVPNPRPIPIRRYADWPPATKRLHEMLSDSDKVSHYSNNNTEMQNENDSKTRVQLDPRRFRLAVVSANVSALFYFCALLWASRQFGASDPRAFTLNVLICLLGAALGWGLGILATPLTLEDPSHFARLGQAASAFLSGYVVSKLDRFLESALYADKQLVAIAWERLCLFAISLLVMFIVVFVNRWYMHRRAVQSVIERTQTDAKVA